MREVTVTNIYDRIARSTKTIVINRGGTRSSKSFSLSQYIIWLMTNEYNRKILIARKTFPALRDTAMLETLKLIKDYGYYNSCDHTKQSNSLIYGPTNTYLKFISIDKPEKVRSTGWNYVWLEEAPEFTYDDYMTLKMRLSEPTDTKNKIFLSFNPSDAFCWIKTELIDKENDVDEIISTYRDNPFLPPDYIFELEKMKSNEAYWKVFGEGEWGTLDNIIYNNWVMVKERNIPICERTIYGCDFGFNNPTTIVECGLTDEGIYLKEKLYRSGMTNNELIEWINGHLPPNSIIYCDVAEPNRIMEMRKAGLKALNSDKSVKDGIDFVKRQTLFVSENSVNTIKELRAYQYKEQDGHPIDEPVKFNDHALDAVRYAIYTHLGNPVRFLNIIT